MNTQPPATEASEAAIADAFVSILYEANELIQRHRDAPTHDEAPALGTAMCDFIMGVFAQRLQAEKDATPAAAVGGDWPHIANEWADVATNGVQWLKNVRDGISTFDEAIADMMRGINQVRDMPRPVPPAGGFVVDDRLATALANNRRHNKQAELAMDRLIASPPMPPTDSMVNAGLQAMKTENVKDSSEQGRICRIYAAMITASPTAQPSAKDGVRACEWCNGTGWLGGPTYSDPGEGGVECQHCDGLRDWSELHVSLMNAVVAYEESITKFPAPKDKATLRKQAKLIREHIASLDKATTATGLVDDATVERAMKAGDEYWNSPDQVASCDECDGTGKVPSGDSQDWCGTCDGGVINTGTEEGAMRAALQSVWPGEKGEGGKALAYVWPEKDCRFEVCYTPSASPDTFPIYRHPAVFSGSCAPGSIVTDETGRTTGLVLYVDEPKDGGPVTRQGSYDHCLKCFMDSTTSMPIDPDRWQFRPMQATQPPAGKEEAAIGREVSK